MATKEEILKSQGLGQTIRNVFKPLPGSGQGLDRLAGLPYGLLAQLYGGAADITGGIGSALGFDEFAVDQYNRADDAYQAGMDKYTKGFGGSGGYSSLVTPQKPPSQIQQIKNQSSIPSQATLNSFIPTPAITGPLAGSGKEGLDAGSEMDLSSNIQNAVETIALRDRKLANMKTDPRGGDKSLEGGKEALENNMEKGFMGGMDSYLSALGLEKPSDRESSVKDIEEYKRDFAKATGIEIDGKPDKRDALMAFGLALMQNKAGKGFNVGKMLSATGEAGEKAMPLLTKAKDKAEAAQIAAGKYALSQAEKGKSADEAYKKEYRAYKNAFIVREMDREDAAAKAAAKGLEYKNVDAQDVVKGTEIHYGVLNGQSVLAKPAADARNIVTAANRYSKGLGTLNEMKDSLIRLADSKNLMGPTGKKFFDGVKDQLIGLGLKDAKLTYGEDAISDLTKADNLRKTIINEYKRLLLQESQVSDYDLKHLEASLGKQGLFGNPNEAIDALDNMKSYFQGQADKVEDAIGQLSDPYYYRNTNEFLKTQEYLRKNRVFNYNKKANINSTTGVPTISLVQSAQQAQNRQKAKI